MKGLICIVVVSALVAPLPVMGTAGSPTVSSAELDLHRVKAGFTGDVPLDIDAWAADRGGLVVLRSDVLDFVAIQLADGVDGDVFLAALGARSDVTWATYDGIARVAVHVRAPLSPNPPNDPLWSSQYGPQLIGAPAAWTKEAGRGSVVVAVLDTGVMMTHEDLLAPCTPGCAQAPYDVYGHGSHVAGTIAAQTNNGLGIAGVAQVQLMSVKALTDAGTTWWSTIAVAVADAALAGADVISMSIQGSCWYNGILLCPELDAAVQLAWSLGSVLVAASGNNGLTTPTQVAHPAAFDNVVAVGAVGPSKLRWGLSQGGPELDLMAPGVSVLSTVPGASLVCSVSNGYCELTGTSMATPHVAGVAALILSHCPLLTNQEVVSILTHTTEDLGSPGKDPLYGYGLVRADFGVEATPAC